MLALWPTSTLPCFSIGGAYEPKPPRFPAIASLQRIDPARLAADVAVLGFRLLERQPDELAAPLNARPVVELVSHFPLP